MIKPKPKNGTGSKLEPVILKVFLGFILKVTYSEGNLGFDILKWPHLLGINAILLARSLLANHYTAMVLNLYRV